MNSAAHPTIIELSTPRDVSMNREWFEIVDATHFWMKWRLDIFKKHLLGRGTSQARCMEIGCGNGVFRKQVEDASPWIVDGCDLDRKALESAAPGRGTLYSYDVSERSETLSQQYDYVFIMDVLEHIDDDRSFLSDSLNLLKPGGTCVINVPQGRYLYSVYDELAGHKRRYTYHELQKLMENCGLQDSSIIHWGCTTIPLLLLRKVFLRLKSESEVIKAGFMPPGALAHQVLDYVRGFETSLPFSMPAGTSLLAFGSLPE